MAVIIPLLAVYGGVTAGVAMAAGAAVTFAGAMAVAGGMAAGLGLIGNDKDFQRLGSTLGMIGSAAGAMQGAAAAGEASQAYGIADGTVDAAESAKFARQGAAAAETGQVGADLGNIAQAGADIGDFSPNLGGSAPGGAPQTVAGSSQSIANGLTGGGQESLAQQFQTGPTQAVDSQGLSYQAGRDSALKEAAGSMTQNDIAAPLQRGIDKASSLMGQAWDGAGKMLDGAGKWVQKNPNAAAMVFNTVGNAYGPEAEALDYRKSIMERANRNANSPIRMRYQTPKTVGG